MENDDAEDFPGQDACALLLQQAIQHNKTPPIDGIPLLSVRTATVASITMKMPRMFLAILHEKSRAAVAIASRTHTTIRLLSVVTSDPAVMEIKGARFIDVSDAHKQLLDLMRQ